MQYTQVTPQNFFLASVEVTEAAEATEAAKATKAAKAAEAAEATKAAETALVRQNPGPSQDQDLGPSDKKSIEKEEESKQEICHFFKNSICKFGISGKNCKFVHPKTCKQFEAEGKCRKKKSCQKLHRTLCKIWKKTGNCTKEECKKFHPKRTTVEKNDEVHMKSTIDTLANAVLHLVTNNQCLIQMEKEIHGWMRAQMPRGRSKTCIKNVQKAGETWRRLLYAIEK